MPMTPSEQLPGLRELLQPCKPFHQIFICTLGKKRKEFKQRIDSNGRSVLSSYIAEDWTHLDVDDEIWRHFEIFDQLNLLSGPHESI